MHLSVAGLWRYPVKTLGGEPIPAAELTADGIPGDRIVLVRGPEGVRTSRRHHRLLGLHATLGDDGQPLVNGLPWSDPAVLALVGDAAGPDAWLEPSAPPVRFDVLPLLVATDGAIHAFGRDVRRLRPNILIGGVDGMDEIDWPGTELRIGDAVIRLDSLRQRCPMTTVDPDTLDVDRGVLRDIQRRFDGRLALNAEIVHPGTIRVGDPVLHGARDTSMQSRAESPQRPAANGPTVQDPAPARLRGRRWRERDRLLICPAQPGQPQLRPDRAAHSSSADRHPP